jgi:methionyl-tRNA formyltransferase
MGTPAFACPILEALLARPDPVVAVVCQPDRARGRGLAVSAPEVKQLAQQRGLPVLQPERLKEPAFQEALRALAPDVIVVAAYGKILPPAILALPRQGCVNVHASLLPRHRGAAPIAWALMAGDPVTGVTIMMMNERMDEGDVVLRRDTPIAPDETGGSLTARLAGLGAETIGLALDGLRDGTLRATPQPATAVTYAPRIEPQHCQLDWSRTAAELERQVRALAPAPSAFTTLDGRRLKVHRAAVAAHPAGGEPRRILAAGPGGLVVGTGGGVLALLELQPEGRRRMTAAEFLAGHRVAPGACLGAP